MEMGMPPNDPEEMVKELQFLTFFQEKKGIEFQRFFEKIMKLTEPSFKIIELARGDYKADGVSHNDTVIYQVYAPENWKEDKVIKKINKDFEGAKEYWNNMKKWVFVYNKPGFTPKVHQFFSSLKTKYEGTYQLEDWGRHELWRRVQQIPIELWQKSFGLLSISEALLNANDYAEIKLLIDYLVEQEAHSQVRNLPELKLVEVREKMKANRFNEYTEIISIKAFPLITSIRKYIESHPDEKMALKIAGAMKTIYEDAKKKSASPDETLWNMVDKIKRYRSVNDSLALMTSLGVIMYFFELCEIFSIGKEMSINDDINTGSGVI